MPSHDYINHHVVPGASFEFNFTVMAPLLPGTYTLQGQMLQNGQDRFGKQLNVDIAINPLILFDWDQEDFDLRDFLGLWF